MTNETTVDHGEGALVVCDRCGDLWRIAEIRDDLPCCPVPLCDLCAGLHRSEVSQEIPDPQSRASTNGGPSD